MIAVPKRMIRMSDLPRKNVEPEKVCQCEQFDLKDGRTMLIIDKDCPNKQPQEDKNKPENMQWYIDEVESKKRDGWVRPK